MVRKKRPIVPFIGKSRRRKASKDEIAQKHAFRARDDAVGEEGLIEEELERKIRNRRRLTEEAQDRNWKERERRAKERGGDKPMFIKDGGKVYATQNKKYGGGVYPKVGNTGD